MIFFASYAEGSKRKGLNMRGAHFMVASLSLWMLPASSPSQLGLPGRLGVPAVLLGVESPPGRLPLPDIERIAQVRAARTQIGTASCRDRACKSVWISGAAVYLRKQQTTQY